MENAVRKFEKMVQEEKLEKNLEDLLNLIFRNLKKLHPSSEVIKELNFWQQIFGLINEFENLFNTLGDDLEYDLKQFLTWFFTYIIDLYYLSSSEELEEIDFGRKIIFYDDHYDAFPFDVLLQCSSLVTANQRQLEYNFLPIIEDVFNEVVVLNADSFTKYLLLAKILYNNGSEGCVSLLNYIKNDAKLKMPKGYIDWAKKNLNADLNSKMTIKKMAKNIDWMTAYELLSLKVNEFNITEESLKEKKDEKKVKNKKSSLTLEEIKNNEEKTVVTPSKKVSSKKSKKVTAVPIEIETKTSPPETKKSKKVTVVPIEIETKILPTETKKSKKRKALLIEAGGNEPESDNIQEVCSENSIVKKEKKSRKTNADAGDILNDESETNILFNSAQVKPKKSKLKQAAQKCNEKSNCELIPNDLQTILKNTRKVKVGKKVSKETKGNFMEQEDDRGNSIEEEDCKNISQNKKRIRKTELDTDSAPATKKKKKENTKLNQVLKKVNISEEAFDKKTIEENILKIKKDKSKKKKLKTGFKDEQKIVKIAVYKNTDCMSENENNDQVENENDHLVEIAQDVFGHEGLSSNENNSSETSSNDSTRKRPKSLRNKSKLFKKRKLIKKNSDNDIADSFLKIIKKISENKEINAQNKASKKESAIVNRRTVSNECLKDIYLTLQDIVTYKDKRTLSQKTEDLNVNNENISTNKEPMVVKRKKKIKPKRRKTSLSKKSTSSTARKEEKCENKTSNKLKNKEMKKKENLVSNVSASKNKEARKNANTESNKDSKKKERGENQVMKTVKVPKRSSVSTENEKNQPKRKKTSRSKKKKSSEPKVEKIKSTTVSSDSELEIIEENISSNSSKQSEVRDEAESEEEVDVQNKEVDSILKPKVLEDPIVPVWYPFSDGDETRDEHVKECANAVSLIENNEEIKPNSKPLDPPEIVDIGNETDSSYYTDSADEEESSSENLKEDNPYLEVGKKLKKGSDESNIFGLYDGNVKDDKVSGSKDRSKIISAVKKHGLIWVEEEEIEQDAEKSKNESAISSDELDAEKSMNESKELFSSDAETIKLDSEIRTSPISLITRKVETFKDKEGDSTVSEISKLDSTVNESCDTFQCSTDFSISDKLKELDYGNVTVTEGESFALENTVLEFKSNPKDSTKSTSVMEDESEKTLQANQSDLLESSVNLEKSTFTADSTANETVILMTDHETYYHTTTKNSVQVESSTEPNDSVVVCDESISSHLNQDSCLDVQKSSVKLDSTDSKCAAENSTELENSEVNEPINSENDSAILESLQISYISNDVDSTDSKHAADNSDELENSEVNEPINSENDSAILESLQISDISDDVGKENIKPKGACEPKLLIPASPESRKPLENIPICVEALFCDKDQSQQTFDSSSFGSPLKKSVITSEFLKAISSSPVSGKRTELDQTSDTGTYDSKVNKKFSDENVDKEKKIKFKLDETAEHSEKLGIEIEDSLQKSASQAVMKNSVGDDLSFVAQDRDDSNNTVFVSEDHKILEKEVVEKNLNETKTLELEEKDENLNPDKEKNDDLIENKVSSNDTDTNKKALLETEKSAEISAFSKENKNEISTEDSKTETEKLENISETTNEKPLIQTEDKDGCSLKSDKSIEFKEFAADVEKELIRTEGEEESKSDSDKSLEFKEFAADVEKELIQTEDEEESKSNSDKSIEFEGFAASVKKALIQTEDDSQADKDDQSDSESDVDVDVEALTADSDSSLNLVLESDLNSDQIQKSKHGEKDVHQKLIEDKSELAKGKSDLVESQSKLVENKSDLVKNKSDLVETSNEVVENKDDLVESQSELVETSDEVAENKGDLVEIQSELVENKTDLVENKTDLIETKTDLVESQSDLVENKTDLVENKIDLVENEVQAEGKNEIKLAIFKNNIMERISQKTPEKDDEIPGNSNAENENSIEKTSPKSQTEKNISPRLRKLAESRPESPFNANLRKRASSQEPTSFLSGTPPRPKRVCSRTPSKLPTLPENRVTVTEEGLREEHIRGLFEKSAVMDASSPRRTRRASDSSLPLTPIRRSARLQTKK